MSNCNLLSLKRTAPLWNLEELADVPEVVVSALARSRADRGPETHLSKLPARAVEGDLRIIEPAAHSQADRRLGLVLRVDSASGFAEVLLVHTAPEMATYSDLILTPEEATAPYGTVVQTDLRGAVWLYQLGERVGHLAKGAFAMAKAVDGTPDSLVKQTPVIATGIPLAGLLDQRWQFKASEGVALRVLTADCTEAMLGQEHG